VKPNGCCQSSHMTDISFLKSASIFRRQIS
jgi:hypothetical protein